MAFVINEHVLPCQHLREYDHATSTTEEAVLRLAIKEYIPKDNPNPAHGDVTIIGAHANGFTKELYEPLWKDMVKCLKDMGISVRAIWMADFVSQGASYVLNEDEVGNEPSWTDHSRDLLHLVNTFRDRMPRPIIGVGHSMGACQIVNLALMHPSLFSTLVLIEPGIMRYHTLERNWLPAKASADRRDLWPSKDAAVDSLRAKSLYQKWDSRVFERFQQYGLRQLPTFLYPDTTGGDVTLTTPRYQEVFAYLRLNTATSGYGQAHVQPERQTAADFDPSADQILPFYCPAPVMTFHQLPHLRPSVLYILGNDVHRAAAEMAKDRSKITGTGVGGSGGIAYGQVKSITLDGSHLLPLENVQKTAEEASAWITKQMQRWKCLTKDGKQKWAASTLRERQTFSAGFRDALLEGPIGQRSLTNKL